MNVSFNGFNENVLTFRCEGEIEKLYPVKIADNATVAMCNTDEKFIGFCLDSDSENATVQMSGHVKLHYSDSAPELGPNTLSASENGTVKEAANGTPCTVLAIDSAESVVEFLF